MNMFIIQTMLLIAIAFLIGCFLGSLLRWLLGSGKSNKQDLVDQGAVERNNLAPQPPSRQGDSPKSADIVHLETKLPKPAEPDPSNPDNPPFVEASPIADDLKQIKGIGKHIETQLNEAGITSFRQIMDWTPQEIETLSDKLAFKGRIEREDWVGQAYRLTGNAPLEAPRPSSADHDTPTKSDAASEEDIEQSDISGKMPSFLKKPRAGGADSLTLVDGIGPALENKLFELGIYHLNQIAKWDEDNATWIGAKLGFPGRPKRENWVEEARALVEAGSTKSENPPGNDEVHTRKTKIT